MLSEGTEPHQLGAESEMKAVGVPLTGRRCLLKQENGGSKSTMQINKKRRVQLVPELTVEQVKEIEEQEKLERSAASVEMKASALQQSHLGKT